MIIATKLGLSTMSNDHESVYQHHVTLQSHTSIAGSEVCVGSVTNTSPRSPALNILLKMFDFNLLLSPSYLILCFSSVLPFLGTFLFARIYFSTRKTALVQEPTALISPLTTTLTSTIDLEL